MDSYEASDRNALEKIIDEFDQRYSQSVAAYKKTVSVVLDAVVAKAKLTDTQRLQSAAAQIKLGVKSILS